VVKYRGSTHGTNEYPFLIDEKGISVLPITAAGMNYAVSQERVPTGVKELDDMLGGKGFYRGSTVLLSGSAGTGKSSLAAHLADATCKRGERCLYFSFEESQAQIIRNMKSIGINLEPHVRKGLLQFHATRPTVYGLEMHLVLMHKVVEEFKPTVTIFDPVTNLQAAGTLEDSTNMLIRVIDFLRIKQITCFMISLTAGGSHSQEMTEVGMSSIVDSWLLLRDVESGGERNRLIYVLKSRGMAHSNQVREFIVTDAGIRLTDVYIGPSGMLTGSARVQQEGRERAERVTLTEEAERQQLALECKRAALEAQVAALRAEFSGEEAIITRTVSKDKQRGAVLALDEAAMGRSRKEDVIKTSASRGRRNVVTGGN
jgi:circadian clock protein KaiC